MKAWQSIAMGLVVAGGFGGCNTAKESTMAAMAVSTTGNAAGEKIFREGTEWVQMNIPAATSTNNPRVLLIGDSITAQYFGPVRAQLKGTAYCADLATSAAVADPVFLKLLEPLFVGYEYAVVQFNNGLHGFDYTDEEYRAGYERALDFIRQKAPKAKLILVLSTPVKPGSNADARINPRVDARNTLVKELAKKMAAEVTDLHSISQDEPDYYADTYHFK